MIPFIALSFILICLLSYRSNKEDERAEEAYYKEQQRQLEEHGYNYDKLREVWLQRAQLIQKDREFRDVLKTYELSDEKREALTDKLWELREEKFALDEEYETMLELQKKHIEQMTIKRLLEEGQ